MEIIIAALLESILAYAISLAASERSSVINAERERKLKEVLAKEEEFKDAFRSQRSIRGELRLACSEMVRKRGVLGNMESEEPLWRLLTDDLFQNDLTDWIMAGGIVEGNEAKIRLVERMRTSLSENNADSTQTEDLTLERLEEIDKAIFSNPMLADWRHNLSLGYLRSQVDELRAFAEEAAGIYSHEKQEVALTRYCEVALKAWDIIDLSNLPEGDIHIATQAVLLRQLYVPLKVAVELRQDGEMLEQVLTGIETRRSQRKLKEAGYLPEGNNYGDDEDTRVFSIGERLNLTQRIVVLGDPGGGKTTMLRWLATALLIRRSNDPAFADLPDTKTLPSKNWIPVLIRCRDIGEADLCRSFTDFLVEHIKKSELLPGEAKVVTAVILDRIARGEAALLIDGLDEITNTSIRVKFCQELERTAIRYPNAPLLVTSRIVGYRDMPYRMGSAFEHNVIAELSSKDKNLFAQQWVEVTEQFRPPAERITRTQELISALHSSDRVERLTGNPMLLTTLALVKRKVGKLPSRRIDLYREAVAVLLNWNPSIYAQIDEREAMPQMEYVAYEMCRRGVQEIGEEELLDLLDRVRSEYPNLRAVKNQLSASFLKLLEARSSIVIQSGGLWRKDSSLPIYEFRHLTLQEYLATRAILDSHYPNREKEKNLAQRIAPLAGQLKQVKRNFYMQNEPLEMEVSEAWRETIRLCVAGCPDDDVDDVMMAIMQPQSDEIRGEVARPRAVLAALCLSDEPNVSEEVAIKVLNNFVEFIGGESDLSSATISVTAREIGRSLWSEHLRRILLSEYYKRPSRDRLNVGFVLASNKEEAIKGESDKERLIGQLDSGDDDAFIEATFWIANRNVSQSKMDFESFVKKLIVGLSRPPKVAMAAAYALAVTSLNYRWSNEQYYFRPTDDETDQMIEVLSSVPDDEPMLKTLMILAMGNGLNRRAVDIIIAQLKESSSGVRTTAAAALGTLGDPRATNVLIKQLDDESLDVVQAAARSLGEIGDMLGFEPLVTRLSNEKEGVRAAMARGLGYMGNPDATEPLKRILNDQSSDVRKEATQALGKLKTADSLYPLLAMLADSESSIRSAAADGLAYLEDGQSIEPLIMSLKDSDATVRRSASEALGRLHDLRAVPALIENLQDPHPNVQESVARVLGAFGDTRAVVPLIEGLTSNKFASRRQAGSALFLLDQEAANNIFRVDLRSPLREHRQTAVHVLAQSKGEFDKILLSRDRDGVAPWIDPIEPITLDQLTAISENLEMSLQDLRQRFEELAPEFGLSVE